MNEMIEQEIPKTMSDDELVRICNEEAARGIGGLEEDNSEITEALDFYFSRRPGLSDRDARDKDSSTYVSPDVMNVIESTVAEIMPAFTADQIAFYVPENAQEEAEAKAESEIVNYLFFEEYDGYILLQQAIKDALLHGNCTAKVYWDDRIEVSYERHEKLNSIALSQVMQPTTPGQTVDILEHDESVIDVGIATPDGEILTQNFLYSVKIRRNTPTGRPVIKSVSPEEAVICGDHDTPVLNNARFVAHEYIVTASDLIEQGYDQDVVNMLEAYTDNIENYSRSRTYDETEMHSSDDSTRLIKVLECYLNIDFDDDGIAERRKVLISGNHLLGNDEWEDVCMVGGTTNINPHKYRGISLYERIKQVQTIKSELSRTIVDGTKLATRQRLQVIAGEANMDDILTSRTGGIVRTNSPQAVLPMPNPEIPQTAYQLLDRLDTDRQYSGGSAVGTASQAQQVSGDTAHGIERVMSAMELGNAVLARTFGETFIQGIFVQLHNLLRKYHKGPIQAKVNGEWIGTIPAQWKKRTSVKVHVGSSQSERQRQAAFLMNIITQQKELAANGSILVDEKRGYTALMDMVKLGGIKNAEKYFVNPESPEGQQAMQGRDQKAQMEQQKNDQSIQVMNEAQQMVAQAEQMKGQAALQSQQAKMQVEQMKGQLEAMKEQLDAIQESAELRYKYDELATKTETERMKINSSTSLGLTELEVSAQKELSEQYNENKESTNVSE